MSEHRFQLGQKVQIAIRSPDRLMATGDYEVVRQLPWSDGEMHYRIKSARETHERVVKESAIKSH